jgi:hypothetical protein
MAQQIDAVIADLSRVTGLSVTRTDVVRLLLREALETRSKKKR